MKTNVMIAIASFLCVGITRAETSKTSIPPDRVSFYEVPLVCPAAPEIVWRPLQANPSPVEKKSKP